VDIQEIEGMGKSEYKVPGGKLLRAKAEIEEGSIVFLQVTGDFFMNPETDLEQLERELIGSPVEYGKIRNTVEAFFSSRGTEITGASPEDFVIVIVKALGL
jgi:lipoate-protein ligase A